MRERTAIGVATTIVVAKGAITWVAFKAWLAIPSRQWPAHRWHIELGTLSQWLAALFSATAAGVALHIAGRDRRTRRQERDEADLTQARLVVEEWERDDFSQDYTLHIHNYGDQGILEVYIEHVQWVLEPTATWLDADELLSIVKPDRDDPVGGTFQIRFVDAAGLAFPRQLEEDNDTGNPQFAQTRGGPEVVYTFMTANGKRWRSGTFVDPPELTSD